MNWTVDRHDLPLSNPFGISRETSETSETATVELTHEGTTGIGAVTPSAYYDESAQSVAQTLPLLCETVDGIGLGAFLLDTGKRERKASTRLLPPEAGAFADDARAQQHEFAEMDVAGRR